MFRTGFIALLFTITAITNQAVAAQSCGVVTTEKTPLNIRVAPNRGAKVVATAVKGSAMVYADAGPRWYYVILNDGKTGYASRDFITDISEVSGKCGLVNTQSGSLNVREGMSPQSKVIVEVPKGAMLRVLDPEGEEGEWLKVQLNNGKLGYVSGKFILLMY